jgi:hypothetical protein
MGILLVLIIVAVIFFALRNKAKTPIAVASHWSHFFEEFQFTPSDFYNQVEAKCKKYEIPNAKYSKVTYAQSGIFSARREYLRVARNEFVFDICAAPFGKGFFVSSWLGETDLGILSKIPVLNTLIGKDPANKSYYQADTEAMFRQCVHSAVLTVIEEIINGKGVRGLTELERQSK